jgi:hypothetical protein
MVEKVYVTYNDVCIAHTNNMEPWTGTCFVLDRVVGERQKC